MQRTQTILFRCSPWRVQSPQGFPTEGSRSSHWHELHRSLFNHLPLVRCRPQRKKIQRVLMRPDRLWTDSGEKDLPYQQTRGDIEEGIAPTASKSTTIASGLLFKLKKTNLEVNLHKIAINVSSYSGVKEDLGKTFPLYIYSMNYSFLSQCKKLFFIFLKYSNSRKKNLRLS